MKTLTKTLIALSLLPALRVFASPVLMLYQGRLLDKGGNPINGSVDIAFRLFDVDAGGDPVWQEESAVAADQGFFRVILGQTAPLDFRRSGQDLILSGWNCRYLATSHCRPGRP